MTIFKMIVVAYISAVLFSARRMDAKIGINWGTKTRAGLIPSMVVDMLLQNQVPDVKIFTSDDNVIAAFSGTGIGVGICIFTPAKITSYEDAKDYVKRKVLHNPTVNIKYILLGNNAIGTAINNKEPLGPIVMAFKYINDAINFYNLQGEMKAVITNSFTGVLKILPNSSRPSESDFKDSVKETMYEILSICNQTNAPFMFDIYPILFIWGWSIDLEFAFFDNKSTHIITDWNGLQYTNLFDFVYDSFVWALIKNGFGNMKVIVSQIGWPTDGFLHANTAYAERFYKGLLPKVASNVGTPMRPGTPIDIYIHALNDEKKNSASVPFSRHWGIYRNNGEPKYKIDLSGLGRDIYPFSARGINLMPARWCAFNGIFNNWTLVQEQFDFACSQADCTSLSRNGSCGMLTAVENVTYAFNSYFQSNYQDQNTCVFKGLGEVVVKDPSRDGCVFSIEIVRGSM